ncbi:hypothetical protein [Muricoccus radiodurans]|uniref:hypothetical protein n=1 Tax=Muricoccus radiodurans TaxID=2231721 RepID=UPI003CF8A05C
MTVELRTDPPLCPLFVGNTKIADDDMFGEVAKTQGRFDRNAERYMPKPIRRSGESDEAMNARMQQGYEVFNYKYGQIFSIFMDGLDEQAMLANWQRWQQASGKIDNAFFKGTRFMGTDRSAASFTARCLKIGLPPGIKVKVGVKTSWSVMDVVLYAIGIRDALEQSGVPQRPMTYDRKMLPARSVFTSIGH